MPGEELATQVLQADLLSVLQLVVVLFVVAIILLIAAVLAMMYYNGKNIMTMATTQQHTSDANAKMIAADYEKTKVMQGQLDELKLLRHDYVAGQLESQKAVETAAKDLHDHEEKAESRFKASLQHIDTTAAQQAQKHKELLDATKTDVIGETRGIVSASTEKLLAAFNPALEALVSLKEAASDMKTRHDVQIDLMKSQHQAQMDTMSDIITKAETDITQAITALEKDDPRENITILPVDPVSVDPVVARAGAEQPLPA